MKLEEGDVRQVSIMEGGSAARSVPTLAVPLPLPSITASVQPCVLRKNTTTPFDRRLWRISQQLPNTKLVSLTGMLRDCRWTVASLFHQRLGVISSLSATLPFCLWSKHTNCYRLPVLIGHCLTCATVFFSLSFFLNLVSYSPGIPTHTKP